MSKHWLRSHFELEFKDGIIFQIQRKLCCRACQGKHDHFGLKEQTFVASWQDLRASSLVLVHVEGRRYSRLGQVLLFYSHKHETTEKAYRSILVLMGTRSQSEAFHSARSEPIALAALKQK